MSPQLTLVLDDSLLGIDEACKTQPDLVRETLISALLLFPLGQQKIQRVQLGEVFRRSPQAQRQSTPPRLHSVISACKEGKIEEGTVEAKFFKHGGVRGVTALSATATDDKQIMRQLEGLEVEELECFLKSIDTIQWHPDLSFMAEAMDRKRPSRSAKKTSLVRPRPPRSTKMANADSQPSHKASRLFLHRSSPAPRARPAESHAAERSTIVTYDHDHTTSLDQSLSHPAGPDASKQASAGRCLYDEETMVMAGLPEFEYEGVFHLICETKADLREATIGLIWTVWRRVYLLSTGSGPIPRIIGSIWTNSTFSEDDDKQDGISGTDNDAGRLRNIQLFPTIQRYTVQSRGRSLIVMQDQNLSGECFECGWFDGCVTGTSTTEEEGSLARGLEIAISDGTIAGDNKGIPLHSSRQSPV